MGSKPISNIQVSERSAAVPFYPFRARQPSCERARKFSTRGVVQSHLYFSEVYPVFAIPGNEPNRADARSIERKMLARVDVVALIEDAEDRCESEDNDRDPLAALHHSTVTLLARLRGLSTLQPRRRAA